jgi:hypothetical protein
MGTNKPMILMPLFDLKSLDRTRRLRCRDFKSAALAFCAFLVCMIAEARGGPLTCGYEAPLPQAMAETNDRA